VSNKQYNIIGIKYSMRDLVRDANCCASAAWLP